MPDTLFSGFWMPDPPPAVASEAEPRRSRRARKGALPATTTEPGASARVLNEALERAQIDVDEAAAAITDVLAGRSVILRLNADPDDTDRLAVRTFLENLIRLTGTLDATRQEAAIARLAEVLLPDDLAAARGALAADNLALRDRFVAETAPLTSAEVGARSGHRSRNPYATAARWKKAGDIFSVHHRGTEYFPAFQFRDGRPHPTIKRVLTTLPDGTSAWQRAFWFVSTNGWLGDKAPAGMLDDPDAVIGAAKREAQEVIG
jgi:hypothetical protein